MNSDDDEEDIQVVDPGFSWGYSSEELREAMDALVDALKDFDLEPIILGDPSVELKPIKKIVCECGGEKAKTTHSDWCPKK